MPSRLLNRILADRTGQREEDRAWESFHEASKTSPYDVPPATEEIRRRMVEMWPSFPYDGFPETPLPTAPRLDQPLSDAFVSRHTARSIAPTALSPEQVAGLLSYSAGETRDETSKGYPRPFRIVPSGGALYPVEIYLHSSRIEGLRGGIYHYHPGRHALQTIVRGDQTRSISAALVQPQLALESAMFIFITGVFERSTFKYGERGYRFVMLEAGHIAQNIVLAAGAMGLGAVTVGGFFDREVDKLLGIDGLWHSTVYMVAIGAETGQDWVGL